MDFLIENAQRKKDIAIKTITIGTSMCTISPPNRR